MNLKNLKSLRQSFNLTQREVAFKLGVGEKTYQNYELGTREPNIDKLIVLAAHFNVSVDYLLGLDDVPKRS